MKSNDADLIQQTINGDDKAFSLLVEKYQKQIHALAWQKIGDFHIAQEITQDTFLTAYQKLETLKHYNRFAGWLYVIADRKCKNWFRKKKLKLQSIEVTDPVELEEVYYSEYMTQQREGAAHKKRRAIVQKLLSQLKESERTVVNLYYIAEMTCEDIGKFLGVSPNTVRSRLHRARNRLKKEESMIKENLSSFHLPSQFTENIMKKISDLKPIVPPTTKPFLPIAISAASAILVLFLFGIGAQNYIRFQEPYNWNAENPSTIEIADTQLVIDIPVKPIVQVQNGNRINIGQGNGLDQNSDSTLFAAQSNDDSTQTIKGDWVKTNGPEGGPVRILFNSTQGELYAGTDLFLYKMSDNKQRWDLISSDLPFKSALQMMEHGDSFYVVSYKEIFASVDKGKTWNSIGARPEGRLIGMTITDNAFYLALSKGVYQSKDNGKTWNIVDKNFQDKKISAMTTIDNTVFIATESGLFRLESDTWHKLKVNGRNGNIRLLVSTEEKLYVGLGNKEKYKLTSEFMKMLTTQKPSISLFYSTDLGITWKGIELQKKTLQNPRSISYKMTDRSTSEIPETIKGTTYQDNLLLYDSENRYYINDGIASLFDFPSSFSETTTPRAVVLRRESDIYVAGNDGVYRTDNAGKTWEQFNSGMSNSIPLNLFAINNTLYAKIGNQIMMSFDNGESWSPIVGKTGQITAIIESDGIIYIKGSKKNDHQLFRILNKGQHVSTVSEIPILKVPDFGEVMSEKVNNALLKTINEDGKKNLENEKKINPNQFDSEKFNEFYSQIMQDYLNNFVYYLIGSLAVHDSTYYVEFNKTLLRCKQGDKEWHNTGLKDESDVEVFDENNNLSKSIGFKIAVSGKTVFAGKRNGNLMMSVDEGDIWIDVTSKLPFIVDQFNDIAFSRNTVYVATNNGVVRSNNGINWQIITDTDGDSLIIERFAVEDLNVYGQVGKSIYQIDAKSDKWKQVTPEIPYQISCFDVDGQTLYVGTFGSGVHRFTLEE